MLIATFGVFLLGNMLAGKCVILTGQVTIRIFTTASPFN